MGIYVLYVDSVGLGLEVILSPCLAIMVWPTIPGWQFFLLLIFKNVLLAYASTCVSRQKRAFTYGTVVMKQHVDSRNQTQSSYKSNLTLNH